MGPPELDPERGMKVTLMLADYAAVAEGKLSVMGAGWNITGPAPAPFALAGIIEVPWNQTNEDHTFRFSLVDLDGHPVELETPEGAQALFFEGNFQVGRPPGVRPGSPIPFQFAINCGPMPLQPGSHFVWQLGIDGYEHEDWRLAFGTRPDAQSQAA